MGIGCQSGKGSDNIRRPNIAAAFITRIGPIGYGPQNGHFFTSRLGKGQNLLIFQQHHAFFGYFLCQGSMFSRCLYAFVIGHFIISKGILKSRFQDTQDDFIDFFFRHFAIANGIFQFISIVVTERHFDVHTCFYAFHSIPQGIDPVGGYEAFKAPFIPKDVCEQVPAMRNIISPKLIIGTHDRSRFSLLYHFFEVGEIDFPQGTFVKVYVDIKAGIFDIVESEMLGASHDVVLLYGLGISHGKLTQ